MLARSLLASALCPLQTLSVLFEAATVAGARALGLESGLIQPGHWADFAAIDLNAPSLQGWTPETLLESVIFGASEEVVEATCVGGEWRDRKL